MLNLLPNVLYTYIESFLSYKDRKKLLTLSSENARKHSLEKLSTKNVSLIVFIQLTHKLNTKIIELDVVTNPGYTLYQTTAHTLILSDCRYDNIFSPEAVLPTIRTLIIRDSWYNRQVIHRIDWSKLPNIKNVMLDVFAIDPTGIPTNILLTVNRVGVYNIMKNIIPLQSTNLWIGGNEQFVSVTC
jgi:hypothetical protein